jgi:hypothetical protein
VNRFLLALTILLIVSGCAGHIDQTTPTATMFVYTDPTPAGTPRLVHVSAQYYLDKSGSSVNLIQVKDFKQYDVNLSALVLQKSVPDAVAHLFANPVSFYCGKGCMEMFAGAGDPSAMDKAVRNVSFIVGLSDRTFVELRIYPPAQ